MSMRFRKVLPTFVLTDLLNGGLNQMMFLRLVEFDVDGVLDLFVLAVGSYVNGSSYLLRFNASLYTGAVDWNKEWFAESDDIRLLMDLGNCLIIAGGWFEFG